MQRRKGTVFVISGPSGCGKTTLGNMLREALPQLVRSVSVTTRPRRKGEKEGREYFFVKEERFRQLVKKGELLEWAKVFGYFYGTPKGKVLNNLSKGKNVMLFIDVQGAMQIKKKLPHAVYIFINAPSIKILRERLKKREMNSLNEINKRINIAREEMKQRKYYDYQVINGKIETAQKLLKSIIIAETSRIKREEGRRCHIFR